MVQLLGALREGKISWEEEKKDGELDPLIPDETSVMKRDKTDSKEDSFYPSTLKMHTCVSFIPPKCREGPSV